MSNYTDLTLPMQRALDKLRLKRSGSAYDLQVGQPTLDALVARRLATRVRDPHWAFCPRTMVIYSII